MRQLMWFTIGFAAACLLGVIGVPGLQGLLWVCGGLAGLAVCCFLRKHKALACAGVALLGFLVGLGWFSLYDSVLLRPARLADGTIREISLTVTDDARITNYGCRVEGVASLGGRTYKMLLYTDDSCFPEPGQVLTLPARLRLTTDGGAQEPTFHRSSGIFLLAYGQDSPTVSAGDLGWRKIPVSLRRWTRSVIADCFPSDAQGLVTALVLGDTSGLTYAQRNAFSLVGISHIAAVSGMHMSILFSIFLFLTFHRRWLSALLGIPILFLFSAMAGFSPSSVRASLMLSLTVLAQLIDKEYDAPTALSFAVLVLLVQNPLSAASVGLQMSVASIAGIILFLEPAQHWMRGLLDPKRPLTAKIWRWLTSGVCVTLSASIFTIPIVVMVFGLVSLISPLANLLSLWAVTLVFGGALGVCMLSLIWQGGAVFLGRLLSLPVRYIFGTAQVLSRFPLAAVYPSFSPYWMWFLLFSGVLVLLFLLGKGARKRYFAFALALMLLSSTALSWLDGSRDHFRVTVLDVGQGQCILLHAEGRSFVVDCGGTGQEAVGETAARALQSMGIFHLDGLILTHPDTDHTSGAAQLTERIPTDAIYTAQPIDGLKKSQILVTADRILRDGDMCLSIFAPISQARGNDSGLSVLFTWQKYDTLITGDMSGSMERRLLDLHPMSDVELLIAGHHGSRYSTCEYLLEALKPEIIAISVGDNTFGHPAREVLERAAEAGAAVYRTDLCGTLTFRG